MTSVGLSLFNYQDDAARSDKYKIKKSVSVISFSDTQDITECKVLYMKYSSAKD